MSELCLVLVPMAKDACGQDFDTKAKIDRLFNCSCKTVWCYLLVNVAKTRLDSILKVKDKKEKVPTTVWCYSLVNIVKTLKF